MYYGWVEKCCPMCGKYYLDRSISHNKGTCGPTCRYEFTNMMAPKKHIDRKITMRIAVFKRQGIVFTDGELDLIAKGLADGVCQICGDTPPMEKLNIDHDHSTNKFRGILCDGCNIALGFAKDNPQLLHNLAFYLEHQSVLP